ncbi:TlpA family protein disulfide reductase [Mucilaginibacter aquariorum]|uniref:TlpA family protein disulfide reductase n=1 Tax=Mucilaginibacter aquariorum TaxID=2967225 RepID=A0ABT1T6X1_9SPHI|nr:TlpA disulfide reductase family protein [Mucilaginibacter aquariorum]MCQ6960342.1 TlpA family protein disulfide reductase [Mucilaginibacter aquariorum]
MKKLIILVLIIGTTTNIFAQFKLSGKVNNTTRADTLYLNIPFIYGYYHDNDIAIPVDAQGNFNKTINVPQQKFATINFEGKTSTLLLTPGKSLHITLNPADTSITNFKGSAAEENMLLYGVSLNAIPFFAKDNKTNPYEKLTNTELQEQIIKPWAAMRDNNIGLIRSSGLSINDKKLIIQEIKANYITQLNFFARAYMKGERSQIFSFIESFYKDVLLNPEILPAGQQYYFFADSYIGYYEIMAFKDLPAEKVKDPSTFLKYYNITIDSGNRVAKLKGKSFINWILVKNNYPRDIAESWLAQNIFTKCSSKDLAYAKPLMEELKTHYPQSKYIPYLSAKMETLEVLLAENRANKDIIIADGYEKMTSIYEIINKLKGKVVYLDIWGTWCGPCKEELRYNPQLKQYFKGKDVAFVYLDMDDDMKDSQWRDFIKVNGMTGLHLRKSNKDIQQFWTELMPKDNATRYYPMYFIFDKEGKLVQANTKRPSDKAGLYKVIEQYL